MSVLIVLGAMLAQADAAPAARLEDLFACRGIADERDRLGCYDRGVATLQRADREGRLAGSDRRAANGEERSARQAEAVVQAFDSRLSAVSQNAQGLYLLTLDDGSRWLQIDRRRLSAEPRAGQMVSMRPATFGAFVARIENAIGVRVRRVR